MAENGDKTVDFWNFAVPLCLVSLVFFSFYFFIFGWILTASIQSFLETFLPLGIAGAFARSGLVITIPIYLLSLVGAIQIVREMKKQGLKWVAGLPICVIIGVILVSTVLGSAIVPLASSLGLAVILGYGVLPLPLAYLFWNFTTTTQPEDSEIKSTGDLSLVFGLIGVVVFVLLILATVTDVPRPPPSPNDHSDHMFDFGSPLVLFDILLAFIYGAILVPYLGVKIFDLGMRYFGGSEGP